MGDRARSQMLGRDSFVLLRPRRHRLRESVKAFGCVAIRCTRAMSCRWNLDTHPCKISALTDCCALVHCRPLRASSLSTEDGAHLKKKEVVAPARTCPLFWDSLSLRRGKDTYFFLYHFPFYFIKSNYQCKFYLKPRRRTVNSHPFCATLISSP